MLSSTPDRKSFGSRAVRGTKTTQMIGLTKRAISHLLILIYLLSSGRLNSQTKNIFVSPTGNDQNTGLSIGQPMKTIDAALIFVTAGDTLFLLPGTYRQIVHLINKKGLPERPVCIEGYSQEAGQKPVIDGGVPVPSNSASGIWMTIQNSEWLEIGNVVFQNGWTNPLRVSNSSYLTFNGCIFYGGKKVIDATGRDTHHLLVQNCFWDQGGNSLWTLVSDAAGMDAWTSMHEGAMQYYNGTLLSAIGTGGSVVIRKNTIVNAFNGIRWSAQKGYDSNVEIYDNTVTNIRDNDFEPEYYTYNLHIYHNRSHNIHKTMSVDNVEGGYIYYYGNRVTSDTDSWSNQIATGFWKVYGSARVLAYPMYAFNNSFCGVGKAFGSMSGKAVQFKHFNNAYYFTGSRGWELGSWDSTNVFDFDLSNKSWASNILNNNQEQNGKIADVRFADNRTFDLRLEPGSPAIDAGRVMAFSELGWVQSFQGAAPDIGAFEGDSLVEGPPFRFRTSPELDIGYIERPRIVRSKIVGERLDVWFSAPLDPSTVSASSVSLREDESTIGVLGVSLSDDNYRMGIDAGKDIDGSKIKLSFNPLPKGTNGADATLWAAALPFSKKDIITGVDRVRQVSNVPEKPTLNIYPNPCNPTTTIRFQLPASGSVTITVYDVLGKEVAILLNEFRSAGTHTLQWDGSAMPTGVYFCHLRAGGFIHTERIILLK
jgi:hypothetical protein